MAEAASVIVIIVLVIILALVVRVCYKKYGANEPVAEGSAVPAAGAAAAPAETESIVVPIARDAAVRARAMARVMLCE